MEKAENGGIAMACLINQWGKKDRLKKKKNLIKSCLVPKFHALDFGRLELVCN